MANDPFLIEAEELLGVLNDPDLRVIDCSWSVPEAGIDSLTVFESGHIPGAQYLDLERVSDETSPYANMLPSPEKFAAELARIGIGAGSTVVIYDGGYVSARIWWMFRTFTGLDVRILNGGWRRWKSIGAPVETGPSAAASAKVEPVTVRPATGVVGWQEVLAAIEGGTTHLLDARTPGRFSGKMSSGYPGVPGGHIPSARNVSWQDMIRQEGDFRFIEADQVVRLFKAAGYEEGATAIFTCGSGVTASILAFQAVRLGRVNWKLYDGSWHEWGQRADLPKVSEEE